MKIYADGLAHLIKMAAMPIYAKMFGFFFTETKRLMALGLGM